MVSLGVGDRSSLEACSEDAGSLRALITGLLHAPYTPPR